MNKQKKLQAVFFDFDGVLVNSCVVKKDAFRHVFADYPSEIVAQILEYHRLHGGISRVEKIRWAHQELLHTPLNDEELACWAKQYSDLVLEAVVAAPCITGAQEFLDFCRADKPELLLFVVSGTPEPELQEIVTRRGLKSYFVEVLGSPTKKPAHIRNQLERWELSAERCLFIGDALTDYDAATKTGLQFIGIQGEVSFPAKVSVLPDFLEMRETIIRAGLLQK